jgi:hypothetical protein
MNLILRSVKNDDKKITGLYSHPSQSGKGSRENEAERAKVHASNSGTYLSFMVFN